MHESTALEHARQAFAKRAWLEACSSFGAADAQTSLDPEDLEQLAIAAYLVARDDAAVAAHMRAHARADQESVEDDRLRPIFTCCHPALAPDAQVALTLREVCGLSTEEIAHAFLTRPPTLALALPTIDPSRFDEFARRKTGAAFFGHSILH